MHKSNAFPTLLKNRLLCYLQGRLHRLAQLSKLRPCNHRSMICIQCVLYWYHFRHRLLRWLDNLQKRPILCNMLCKYSYSKDNAKQLKIL